MIITYILVIENKNKNTYIPNFEIMIIMMTIE